MLPKDMSMENISVTINEQIIGLVQCMRVKQWTKNLLVFAALLFSTGQTSQYQLYSSCFAFVLFCLLSSSVYLLNDFFDRKADRLHPEKCLRPMASGLLNPYFGLLGCFGLLSISLIYGFALSRLFGVVLVAYFINNVLYSIRLKHIVLVDIMSIAFGFVLRAVGGGLAIKVAFTPWFLLCTLLLALFLAIGKRRHELLLLEAEGGSHRRVLQKYSIELLDQLNNIVTTATIMCYSLYTFTSGKPIELMFTIPLVIYGIFRYLYLIHVEKQGGAPEKILVGDKHILLTTVIYGIVVVVILNNYQ